MEQESCHHNRLVIVLCPFQGHISPLLQLATTLHSKGFSITIVHTNFNSPNPAIHPQFTFVSIPDNLPDDVDASKSDHVSMLLTINKNCLNPFKDYLLDLQSFVVDKEKIAGIIYDGFMYFAQTVSDELKIPGFGVRPNAAATLLTFSVFRSDDNGYITLKDFMPEEKMPVLRLLKLREILEALTKRLGGPIVEFRPSVTESLKRASAIIVLTMQFLEQDILENVQEYFPPPIFAMGPIHKLAPWVSTSLLEEDSSCISWLDSQAPKSVIYVSFGSMASLDQKQLLETAWGLADSEQPFLWVIRDDLAGGTDCSELLPESFKERIGERGCIVKWAPQKKVLAHQAIGGFWTHCGWNSTLESVCEGVPMLCKPFFGDQFVNMRYICDVWKLGLEIEGEVERGCIERRVRELMVDAQGQETRQRASKFKKKADLCLREDGSSIKELNKLVDQIASL